MKSYEEFSASVYQKAETRRQKARERLRAIRNTALCVVAMLTVALFTGMYSRQRAGLTIKNDLDVQQIHSATENTPRKASGGDRPQMLIVMKDGGKSKARVLRNPEDQQAFVGQLSPVEDAGKASLKQEDSEAKTIYSLVELLDYLAELPADSMPEMEDYDEAFFEENNLCVMPMDLETDEPVTEPAGESQPYTEPQADTILTTIPDNLENNLTPADAMAEDSTVPEDEEAAANFESTVRPPFPSAEAGDIGSQLLQRFVRVFILLPVSKAAESTK